MVKSRLFKMFAVVFAVSGSIGCAIAEQSLQIGDTSSALAGLNPENDTLLVRPCNPRLEDCE